MYNLLLFLLFFFLFRTPGPRRDSTHNSQTERVPQSRKGKEMHSQNIMVKASIGATDKSDTQKNILEIRQIILRAP